MEKYKVEYSAKSLNKADICPYRYTNLNLFLSHLNYSNDIIRYDLSALNKRDRSVILLLIDMYKNKYPRWKFPLIIFNYKFFYE